jgi:hypothetical protein
LCGRAALVLSICAGLWACGDDDSGGISTGLPKDEQLSELDAQDRVMACETVAAELGSVITPQEAKRLECTTLAVPQSLTVTNGKPTGDVAKCRQLVDRCMSGEAIAVGSDVDVMIDTDLGDNKVCTESSTAAEFQGCSATVGEYENCLNAALSAVDRLFAALDCSALSNLDKLQATVGDGFDIPSLEACKPLAAKCPNIDLGGDDEEASFEAAP